MQKRKGERQMTIYAINIMIKQDFINKELRLRNKESYQNRKLKICKNIKAILLLKVEK